MRAPTGEQFTLSRLTSLGKSEAVITEVAASLREFRIDGVDLVQPYAESLTPPFADGIVLVPWPNRIPDGRWLLNGEVQQLDITEPARHNAIHGLLRFAPYRLISRTEDSVTLGATVFPQHGYPFLLETTVTYALTDDGMSVTHGIRNDSTTPAPAAIGTHPFLTIGDAVKEDLVLVVHGASRFPVDERLNVSAEVPVAGSRYDLREGQRLADVSLDDAFGEVTPVDRVTATLTAPDGRQIALWQDENFPYVQVFTTREFPTATGVTLAVAIEPMTAPANAFNTGQSLRWLHPGEHWSAVWGIRYSK